MSTAQHFTPFDRVRFTTNNLGTLTSGYKFTENIVGTGDFGEIIGPLPDGWFAVRPDAFPDEWVPVDPSMIEPA